MNILKGAKEEPVVIPGKPAESEIIARITAADLDERMPPEGDPLKSSEIAALKEWIAAGAPVPATEESQADPRDHWSFQQVKRPSLPQIKNQQSQIANPIDKFLEAKRRQHNLSANPPAPRGTQLRRVYLDLIGLPPTRDELRAFLDDNSPDAYEKIVDKLLASPQYGERWGRHWMDVWRYSD